MLFPSPTRPPGLLRAARGAAVACAMVSSALLSAPLAPLNPAAAQVSDEEHHCLEDHDANEQLLGSYGPKPSDVDCSARTDTGYRNGQPFTITVVSVEGKPVERETANAYWVMREAAAAEGVNIRISSGFRTNAEQQYYYDCYTNCNCNMCNLAARPGYSNHQSGHALDLNTSASGVLSWLNNNGARFGFSRTVPSENWHWEWWGGGPGGGVCDLPECEPLPPEGGRVDDADPCFDLHGPAEYWRSVTSEGVGGGLRWTNAWSSDTADNWARWRLILEEEGEYLVEVSTGHEFGICAQTPYRVRHGGEETRLTLDQSSPEVWQPLGMFTFAAGGGQSVDVFDNVPGTAQSQHIAADAVRLTRVEPAPDGGDLDGGYIDMSPPAPDAALEVDLATPDMWTPSDAEAPPETEPADLAPQPPPPAPEPDPEAGTPIGLWPYGGSPPEEQGGEAQVSGGAAGCAAGGSSPAPLLAAALALLALLARRRRRRRRLALAQRLLSAA